MSVESHFLVGRCWMTYSFWHWCQQIIPKNSGFQSTAQTSFLPHPLPRWRTGLIFSVKKMVFKRKRCRNTNWFSPWHRNDALPKYKEHNCNEDMFWSPSLPPGHRGKVRAHLISPTGCTLLASLTLWGTAVRGPAHEAFASPIKALQFSFVDVVGRQMHH